MGFIGIPSQWNYTGDFVTRLAATQANINIADIENGVCCSVHLCL